MPSSFSRRTFLQASTALALSAPAAQAQTQKQNQNQIEKPPTARPKVAAIFTVLRFRSHAFNILENMLGPYLFNGARHEPQVQVVSLYADQRPADDMAQEVSQRFQIPLYSSIGEALCLGGKSLAVDAVLSIGEHGDYPHNELGQHLYPRKQFFDQALAIMERSGRYVPFFNDKHLSYRWDWAQQMYDTARQHKMPLMAGSSVPLAERRPPWELPADADIEEAIAIHGGGFESYDFHGLELLQSFVESRRGGETGIAEVEFVGGEAFERAKNERWSQTLVEAALAAERAMDARRQSRPSAGVFTPAESRRELPHPRGPYAICLKYHDGLRGTVLSLSGGSDRWLFACRLRGETQPRATAIFNGPWGNRCLFMALTHAIEQFFVTRQEPYPIDRTLLTTGAVESSVRSYHQRSAIRTPQLLRSYRTPAWQSWRESGASWRVLSVDTPQSTRIEENRFG